MYKRQVEAQPVFGRLTRRLEIDQRCRALRVIVGGTEDAAREQFLDRQHGFDSGRDECGGVAVDARRPGHRRALLPAVLLQLSLIHI